MNYSLDHLIEDYRDNGYPNYIVMVGKEIRCRYDNKQDKDMDEGEEKLRKCLNRLENGTAKVRIYSTVPSKGNIDLKTEPHIILTYEKKYTVEEKNQYWEGRGLGSHMIQEIRDLKTEIAGLKLQMDEPETDEELEEQAQPQSIIAGLMGNPAVQNIIASFLTNLSANVVSNHVTPTPANNTMYARPQAMAGIDTSLEATIESLVAKGVTQADFEKLDAMPSDRLSFLLTMLRNQ